jgi:hypothetical protein
MDMKDIEIKKDGKTNASILPKTDKAKKIFAEQKCPDGFVVSLKEVHKILTWSLTHNLSLDSEVEIVIPKRPMLTREQGSKIVPICE